MYTVASLSCSLGQVLVVAEVTLTIVTYQCLAPDILAVFEIFEAYVNLYKAECERA